MNLRALHELLVAEGFRPDAYELGDAINPSETYVLQERSGGWVTFYAERGNENSLTTFSTLDQAAQDLRRRLRADPSAHRS